MFFGSVFGTFTRVSEGRVFGGKNAGSTGFEGGVVPGLFFIGVADAVGPAMVMTR